MALILSIETSTAVCSVALHENEKLLAIMEVHQEYSHASKLGTLIDELTKISDVRMAAINAIAISSGPGSYTGLRIGASLAKGLCYALDVPLVAVPTLKVLAAGVASLHMTDSFLCPMIDARRMEVFCQIFSDKLEAYETAKPLIVEEKSFERYLDVKPVIFFGNGALKCRDVIVHPNARFLSGMNPSAAHLGSLAYGKFSQGDVENVFDFAPDYLKEFYFKKKTEVLNGIR